MTCSQAFQLSLQGRATQGIYKLSHMYSLTELNTFIPDLEVSANDTDVANITDSVIIKNVAYTTAEDTTQNGVYKEVPARTDKLIVMSFDKLQLFVML